MNGVRCRRRRLVLCGLIFSGALSGCSVISHLGSRFQKTGAKSSAKTGELDSASPVQKKIKAPFIPKKLHLRANYRLRQLDAIHRETWWVITGKRAAEDVSPFGRLARAVQTEFMKEPLARKVTRFCETYQISWQKKTAKSLPQEWLFFEKCQKTPASSHFGKIELLSKDHWKISFVPGQMAANFGIIASIRARQITCDVSFDVKSDLVEKLKCLEWHQDVGPDEVLHLDTFEFSAKGPMVVTVKGKVYRDLNTAVRVLEGKVPLEGKGELVERELPPEKTSQMATFPTPLPVPGSKMATAADHKPQAGGVRVVDPKDHALIGRNGGHRRNAIVGPNGELISTGLDEGMSPEEIAAQNGVDSQNIEGDGGTESEDADPAMAGVTEGEDPENTGPEMDADGNPVDLADKNANGEDAGDENQDGAEDSVESTEVNPPEVDGSRSQVVGEEDGRREDSAADPRDRDPRDQDPRDRDPRDRDPRAVDPRDRDPRESGRAGHVPPRSRSPAPPLKNSEPEYIEGDGGEAGGVLPERQTR